MVTTFQQVDRLAEAEARVQTLTDALEATLKVLGEVEWRSGGCCPSCGEWDDDGHADDCGLATALEVGQAAMRGTR